MVSWSDSFKFRFAGFGNESDREAGTREQNAMRHPNLAALDHKADGNATRLRR
jgi:hypothetical protein